MLNKSTILKNWKAEYSAKLSTASEALKLISSGDTVYVHSHAAAPHPLLEAMVARSSQLRDVKIVQIMTLGAAQYARSEYSSSFKVQALFIGPNVREAVNSGRADYIPIFLHDIPSLLGSNDLPIDVCLVHVSPPDAHGFCSYGVSVDCTIAARKAARIVIAEVNKQMPRTYGRSFVHISKFDRIVETDRPLPELASEEPSMAENAIGKNVASLVEDGATIQLGIGAVPNAVLKYLRDRQDLGVHSEMLSD
ncbi:MAG: 4-hydroxybutyrate CoA-transferase, partial [Cyanobacteria bacterium SZAS LIN-5]|nr:4-hydroxybutyrate CoA-transferase [Cyanobacteria bacterium SZAS LIN-5]